MKVVIKKSTKPKKKMMAIFTRDNGRKKTDRIAKQSRTRAWRRVIHFGSAGMSDFTKHKDIERKRRYEARHKKRENWNDPLTAGALSKWILWNKPSLRESIKDFKKKFNLN